MCGVPFTALLVFSLGFKFLLLLGRSYSNRDFYSRISETPYFPVQVLFALVLGWLLDHSQPHKSVVGLGIPIGNSLPLMHHTCNFRAGGDICACSIAGQAVTFFRLGLPTVPPLFRPSIGYSAVLFLPGLLGGSIFGAEKCAADSRSKSETHFGYYVGRSDHAKHGLAVELLDNFADRSRIGIVFAICSIHNVAKFRP
jgi:hypothetical protein